MIDLTKSQLGISAFNGVNLVNYGGINRPTAGYGSPWYYRPTALQVPTTRTLPSTTQAYDSVGHWLYLRRPTRDPTHVAHRRSCIL